MTRNINEGLALAPTFTPHRVNVTAVDQATPHASHLFGHGMDSHGVDEVIADVKLVGTSVTIKAAFWSALEGAFVLADPDITWTLTASRTIRFKTGGRRFKLVVTAVTALTRLDIDVAAAPPRPEDFA